MGYEGAEAGNDSAGVRRLGYGTESRLFGRILCAHGQGLPAGECVLEQCHVAALESDAVFAGEVDFFVGNFGGGQCPRCQPELAKVHV